MILLIRIRKKENPERSAAREVDQVAQHIRALSHELRESLVLPDPEEEVMTGVMWGDHYALFTPAFWATMAWMETSGHHCPHRLGQSLKEEVAACLLGGHGIPAEVGLAAFYRLRQKGLFDEPVPSEEAIFKQLSRPLQVGRRSVRYRFARQRATFVSEALKTLRCSVPPLQNDVEFRNWLMELKGIGPKTASWITRNWLDSDHVAIIDIHIHRAGLIMGLYDDRQSPSRNYFDMESKFLDFAHRIDVRPSRLDALIWRQMKDAGSIALEVLKRLRA
jgi:N-glycosylase/DNA lyase